MSEHENCHKCGTFPLISLTIAPGTLAVGVKIKCDGCGLTLRGDGVDESWEAWDRLNREKVEPIDVGTVVS